MQQGMTTAQSVVVPSGKRWIVSCIDVYWGGGTDIAAVNVRGSGGQTIFIAQPADPNIQQPTQGFESQSWNWTGHQVLYALESLSVTSNGAAVDVTISGYELDDP